MLMTLRVLESLRKYKELLFVMVLIYLPTEYIRKVVYYTYPYIICAIVYLEYLYYASGNYEDGAKSRFHSLICVI